MSRLNRPTIVFGTFWLVSIAFMVEAYIAEPPDPTLTGTAVYGSTYPDELWVMLLVTAVEIALFVGILRPWSYRRSWGRAAVALVLLTPWVLLWGPLGLHLGPTTHRHTMWLALFWVGLLVAALWSGIVAPLLGRARSSRTAV